MASELSPRIQQRLQRGTEVRHVTSHERQIVHARCGSDEGIHYMNWFAAGFTLRDQPSPFIGYRPVN
jgi:hypothetical protein